MIMKYTMIDVSFGGLQYTRTRDNTKRSEESSKGSSHSIKAKSKFAYVSCLLCRQRIRKYRPSYQQLLKMLN